VAELSVPSHCLLPFVPLSYHAFPEWPPEIHLSKGSTSMQEEGCVHFTCCWSSFESFPKPRKLLSLKGACLFFCDGCELGFVHTCAKVSNCIPYVHVPKNNLCGATL
jgi:hypothetical protein